MPLTDAQVDQLILAGASDDDILAIEAEEDAKAAAEQPSLGQKAGSFLKEAALRLTPAGSVAELAGQLSGDRPTSGFRAGLAAADLASLGLAGKVRAGVEGAKAGARGVASALLGGAGAGAGSWGAEAAGAPAPVQLLAGLAGGMGAARAAGAPVVQAAVPKGEEVAAVSRAAQRMGINVPTPATPRPRDVQEAWGGARRALGAEVGAAKEAALQTAAKAQEIPGAIGAAVQRSLAATDVPVTGGRLNPALAVNPAGARRALDKAALLYTIPEEATGPEALKMANNILEGFKKEISESTKLGTGVAGRNASAAASAWQEAIDSLGPADKVAAAKAIDSAFKKLVTLQKITEGSATLQGGNITPIFSPRRFASLWEKLKPAERARFSPDEVAIIDAMIQQRPGIIDKAISGVVDYAKSKGVKGISFTPQPRFYEPRPALMPYSPGTARSALGAALQASSRREE